MTRPAVLRVHPPRIIPIDREDDVRAHQRAQCAARALALGIHQLYGPVAPRIEPIVVHTQDALGTYRRADAAAKAQVLFGDILDIFLN